MVSKRHSMTYLLACYLVLVLFLSRACLTTSNANVDGLGLNTSADRTDLGVGENDAAIQCILSRLSSWMKEKRKNDKRNRHDFDDDVVLHQQQMPHKTELNRPFVTLAYAQTLDGMIGIASKDGTSKTKNLLLSCPASMTLTHHLRNLHDAILVGGSTFLLDQPRLNVRLPFKYGTHEIVQPMPVVLDTHLKYLQLLLFDKIISTDLSSLQQSSTDGTLPDIMLERIKARHPTICCSSDAAKSFLDLLEVVFQDQHENTKRKREKSYKITVYKKIDENDHEADVCLPIKITIRITHHKKHDDDVLEDVTLTLLPCRMHKKKNSLDLRHVLHQLHNQFAVETVMVEGGAGILSSFLNECVGGPDIPDGSGSQSVDSSKVVDCICVTTAPKVIGGKWGLPVFGDFGSMLPHLIKNPSANDADDSEEDDTVGKLKIKDGEFFKLGQDSTFLGRIDMARKGPRASTLDTA
jgi:riboflavin biosynthesis pyrimidine reductase